MTDDREVFQAGAALLNEGLGFVMATVVRTQGSTPRNAGAMMLWRPGLGESPGAIVGTIGGGRLESMVIEAAHLCHERRGAVMERFVLGADADQCCGGVVEVFLQWHGPRARVVVFGAGHVSHELHLLLRGSGLETVIADDRADWNSGERFPGARRATTWDEGVLAVHEHPDRTLVVVMTCSHDTDLALLRRLLEKPPAFVGLIGSRSKRACLFTRLAASGADGEAVRRVQCPVGVGDTGKEPKSVAVSIAARLLMEARALDGARDQPA